MNEKALPMYESRILVTGGAGSIGSELVRQLAPNSKVFILDTNETDGFLLMNELQSKGHWVEFRLGDVRDKDTVFDIFSDFKPEYIFHAAALKHVSPAQKYPREYVSTNILGTLNLIEEAKKWECVKNLIFISTDKAVHPTNVMGATKMCAEVIVRSMGYTAVRFGNVAGSRGSLLEIWQRQHEQGEPLTITDEKMTRYFMSIPEACSLVIEAAQKGKGGEVFILDMGEPKRIVDVKEELYPDYPHTFIGVRPGESLTEVLMSEEEKIQATKQDRFYVIPSSVR